MRDERWALIAMAPPTPPQAIRSATTIMAMPPPDQRTGRGVERLSPGGGVQPSHNFERFPVAVSIPIPLRMTPVGAHPRSGAGPLPRARAAAQTQSARSNYAAPNPPSVATLRAWPDP